MSLVCPPNNLCLSFFNVSLLLVICIAFVALFQQKQKLVAVHEKQVKPEIQQQEVQQVQQQENENGNENENRKNTIVHTNLLKLPHVQFYSIPVQSQFTTPTRLPVNIRTRGPVPDTQQIGILTNTEKDKILPLFGNPTYAGSSKWNYYAATDKFNQISIPVEIKNKNCISEDCNEVYDGDEVNIPSYGDENFKVTLYQLDKPRYIPYIF
jgi:hypothetical protein